MGVYLGQCVYRGQWTMGVLRTMSVYCDTGQCRTTNKGKKTNEVNCFK